MTLLLDTHYVVALLVDLDRLTAAERAVLDGLTSPVVSVVSLWELRLKWEAHHRSGDRKGPVSPERALEALRLMDVRLLALTPDHAVTALLHPIPHKDPFDEFLLVQAQIEGLQLLTRDRKLHAHPLAVSADDAPA